MFCCCFFGSFHICLLICNLQLGWIYDFSKCLPIFWFSNHPSLWFTHAIAVGGAKGLPWSPSCSSDSACCQEAADQGTNPWVDAFDAAALHGKSILCSLIFTHSAGGLIRLGNWHSTSGTRSVTIKWRCQGQYTVPASLRVAFRFNTATGRTKGPSRGTTKGRTDLEHEETSCMNMLS